MRLPTHERSPSQPWIAAACLAALVAVTAWGGYLRLRQLDAQSFWMDEAFSWCHAEAIARHGTPLLDNGIVSRQYPIPHYAMAAALRIAGPDPAAARIPGALAGVLCIPLLYAFARRLSVPPAAALAAAFVLAFLTLEVTSGRQARYYTLVQVTALLACLSAWRFRQKPSMFSAAVFLVALTAAVLCHPSGAMCAVFAAALGWTSWRRHGGTAAIAGILLLVAAGWMGWIPLTWRPERWTNYASALAGQFGWSLALVAAGLALAFARRDPGARAVAVMILVYFVYLGAFSPLSHFRYILPVLPFVIVLGAWGAANIVGRIPSRPARMTAALAFTASIATADVSLKPFRQYYLGPTSPQPDWREAYRWIAADHPSLTRARIASNVPEIQKLYAPDSERLYIPINLTGKAGDLLPGPRYTSAVSVTNLAHLKSAGAGYIIMDDLGLARSGPPDIVRALMSRPPDHVVRGPFPLYVWRVPNLR